MNEVAVVRELRLIARDLSCGCRIASAEQEVERLLKKVLPNSPFRNRAYAVGGFVRDSLLKHVSKDLDVVVEGEGGAKQFVVWLKRLWVKELSSPRQLGAGYPIWHVAFKDDIVYKGERYSTKGGELEVADTQKESFPDEGSRQRVTQPGTLRDDIDRRDFTVNMLLKDLSTGEIVDLTGTGVSDIERGILRGNPGVDFNKILRDDPLRMMRLVRFQAKYGWKIPLSVLKTVKRNASRIKIVSAERVRDELVKVMKIGKLAQAVRLMSVVGLLKHVMPEVDALRGVDQKNKDGWHQEGDVWKHTLLVLRSARPGVESQLAALLHDVGKPSVQERFGEFFKFVGHDEAGGEIAEAMMRRMKFDNTVVRKVGTMVRNHMRPHGLGSGEVSSKALRRFVREVGEGLVDAVLDLAEADALGTIPSKNEIPDLRKKIEDAVKVAPAEAKPVLDGRDVISILNIKPGREVGKALEIVRDIMDESAGKGREVSKLDAERELIKRWNSK